MFEFNQLRCFVAVATDLHFGRAARRLNMTQPPLSRQIKLMEQALGVVLFERSSRAVHLTAAGRSLLPEARHLLQLAEGAALAARRVARGDAGTLTQGFTAGASYGFLPRLVASTMAAMPDVDLVLREMITARQMEALAAGRLDAALVRLPIDRRGVETMCVLRERLLLAAPDGHRLATGPALSLQDLDRAPVIMYSVESPTEALYFRDLVASLFRAADVAPNFVQHVGQVHAVMALVGAGMGVALVPQSAMHLLARGVVFRDLAPIAGNVAELHLAWRSGHDNPAFTRFLDRVVPTLLDDCDPVCPPV